MVLHISSGMAIGTIVSLLSWGGNRSGNKVSVFPDASTALVLAGLILLATWFLARRSQLHDAIGIWKLGGVIAMTAGLVFGALIVLLGLTHWNSTVPVLLPVFGFLAALVSALLCGAAASALISFALTRHART